MRNIQEHYKTTASREPELESGACGPGSRLPSALMTFLVRSVGNPQDLAEFLRLVESPIRTPQRELALGHWQEYKLKKQAQHVAKNSTTWRKRGVWTKGTYMASLTAPTIDLRGASLKDVCIGYADLRGVRLDDAVFAHDAVPWSAMKGAKLEAASLRRAKLQHMRFIEADLRRVDLRRADLTDADLTGANLAGADLRKAVLTRAKLSQANMANADLRGAMMRGSNLQGASLVGASLQGANLCGSRVYGVSAWDVEVDDNEALRRDLIVTPPGQPDVTVDNIEVAQFVYLLLSNPKIRDVIDTVCKRGGLILGRFSAERKAVLDALRTALRARGYVAMVFDFEKPTERDFSETVKTLAGLCKFIIADITNPRSSPMELQATVPDYMVPFVPIIAQDEAPFCATVSIVGAI